MLTAAAVCPHPPLLVPELAGAAAPELDGLRDGCRRAVDLLSDADVLYIVGADVGARASGLAPWGVDVSVDVPEPLPLPLLVGGWLTAGRHRSFVVVDPALDSEECADLGRELAESAQRVGLLTMGDGSARRDVKAPGYLDERASGFDADVSKAFAAADWDALAALDAGLCADLLAAGRPAWQLLAGAAAPAGPPATTSAELVAPYGVGYHLASWTW